MILASCTIVLLCLMTVSHSAPLACTELIRPLDQVDLHHLDGKRFLVAGSISVPSFLDRFKQRDSAVVNFYSSSSDTNFAYSGSIRTGNECIHRLYNISLEGSKITYEGTDQRNLSASLINTTCNDCMLMLVDVQSGARQHLYLFSRRRQLEQREMEEFRAQVRCLNMPPPAVLDATKKLCPDEPTPIASTEEETEGKQLKSQEKPS